MARNTRKRREIKPLSNEEFKSKVDRLGKLMAVSEGLNQFINFQIKSLFSARQDFREYAANKFPGEHLSTLQNKVLENPGVTKDYLVWAVGNLKKKRKAGKGTITKEDELIVFSRKILRGRIHKQKAEKEIDKIIEGLVERGGDDGLTPEEKKDRKEKIRRMVLYSGLKQDVFKKVSNRYESNNLHNVGNVDAIFKKIWLGEQSPLNEDFLKTLRKHLPRVGST